MNQDRTQDFCFPVQFFSTTLHSQKNNAVSTQQHNFILPPPTYIIKVYEKIRFIPGMCLAPGKFQYWKVEGDDKGNSVAYTTVVSF